MLPKFNPNNIPIIGQQFEAVGAFLQIVLRCKCQPAGQEAILMVIGTPGQMNVQCPACRKVYMLAEMPRWGEFKWAVGMPREGTEASAAPEAAQ